MKFNFKIQQYQTDAVDAVVNVFAGQPYSSGVSYIRDTGTLSQKPQQLSFLALADKTASTVWSVYGKIKLMQKAIYKSSL